MLPERELQRLTPESEVCPEGTTMRVRLRNLLQATAVTAVGQSQGRHCKRKVHRKRSLLCIAVDRAHLQLPGPAGRGTRPLLRELPEHDAQ
jgi:hypothetical protein